MTLPFSVRRSGVLILCAVAFTAVAACDPIRKTHGYVPQPGHLKKVEIGTDTKAEVAAKIGRPTAQSMFDDNEWYYISRTTETEAFFAPDVIDQKVVLAAFDDSGTLTELDSYGLEDGRVVNLVTRTTPTRGKRLTILQQLLGNLGKFSPDQISGDAAGF